MAALAGATSIGTLLATLGLDASDFKSGMAAAEGQANALAGTLKGPLGAAANVATTALAAVAAAAAGVGVGLGASIASAANFEKTMSGVKAVSGASAGEMKQLSDLALQLGADTSFSASQAAQGLEELVKGGISIGDIMGGGAKAALDLAAAGGINLGSAAEIAADAMNSFNLKGGDLAHVADQIAGAANASSIDVMQFKLSLSQVGAVAKLAGQDFDSTATAIALMGAAGVKGQDAGTSLKTFLMNLQPTTKAAGMAMKELGIITADGANQFFDASGKAKGMREIAEVLNRSLKGLTQQQKLQKLETIFGSDAIRAASILADGGAAAYDKMADSMGKVTAASVGAERLNNLSGSIEQLKGSVETAAITFGMAFLPMLKQGADAATGFVNSLLPWIKSVGPQAAAQLKATAAQVTAAAQAILSGNWGAAWEHIGQTVTEFAAGVDQIIPGTKRVIVDAFTFVTRTAIPAVIGAFNRLLPTLQTLGGGLLTLGQNLGNTFGKVLGGDFAGAWGSVGETLDNVGSIISRLTGVSELLAQQGLGVVYNGITNLATFIRDTAAPAVMGFATGAWAFLSGTAIPAARAAFTDVILPAIQGVIGFITDTAIPAVKDLGPKAWDILTNTVLPNAKTAFGTVKDFIATEVIPRLVDVGTWIVNEGLPRFNDLIGKLKDGIKPAFDTVVGFIKTEVLPRLSDVAMWIVNVGLPKLGDLAGSLKTTLQPAFDTVVGFIKTDVLPRLSDVTNWVINVGLPKLGDLATSLKGPLTEAFGTVIGFVKTDVLPRLADITNWIINTALPKIGDLSASLAHTLRPAFDVVLGFVRDQVLPRFEAITKWINDAALPKVAEFAGQMQGPLTDAFNTVWEKVGAVLGNLGNYWKFVQEQVLPQIDTWVKKLKDDLVPQLISLAEKLQPLVVQALKDFHDELQKHNIPETYGQVIQNLVDTFKAVRDILGGGGGQGGDGVVFWFNVLRTGIETFTGPTRVMVGLLDDLGKKLLVITGALKSFWEWVAQNKVPIFDILGGFLIGGNGGGATLKGSRSQVGDDGTPKLHIPGAGGGFGDPLFADKARKAQDAINQIVANAQTAILGVGGSAAKVADMVKTFNDRLAEQVDWFKQRGIDLGAPPTISASTTNVYTQAPLPISGDAFSPMAGIISDQQARLNMEAALRYRAERTETYTLPAGLVPSVYQQAAAPPAASMAGTGGGVDYNQLAESVVGAMRRQPPIITLDGRVVSEIVRANLVRIAERNGVDPFSR